MTPRWNWYYYFDENPHSPPSEDLLVWCSVGMMIPCLILTRFSKGVGNMFKVVSICFIRFRQYILGRDMVILKHSMLILTSRFFIARFSYSLQQLCYLHLDEMCSMVRWTLSINQCRLAGQLLGASMPLCAAFSLSMTKTGGPPEDRSYNVADKNEEMWVMPSVLETGLP